MRGFSSQPRDRLIQPISSGVKNIRFLWRMVMIVLACGLITGISLAQGSSSPSSSSIAGINDPCVNPSTHSAISDAFRLVCAREGLTTASRIGQKVIVIGFLGGFVKRNDVNHPEVLFADYLNSRYGPVLHAEVFGNHEAKQALDLIIESIDTNKDRPRSSSAETLKIILYGHSWGASEVLTFARELEARGIPVALTIQVDSVRKMGQNDRTVPANVSKAVNFYQRKGFTPGRPLIVSADAERTTILGNFHMIYKDPNIRCDNYRWLSRVLNKPHHLIENDPHIWDQIVSLIDSELALRTTIGQAQFKIQAEPAALPE